MRARNGDGSGKRRLPQLRFFDGAKNRVVPPAKLRGDRFVSGSDESAGGIRKRSDEAEKNTALGPGLLEMENRLKSLGSPASVGDVECRNVGRLVVGSRHWDNCPKASSKKGRGQVEEGGRCENQAAWSRTSPMTNPSAHLAEPPQRFNWCAAAEAEQSVHRGELHIVL